MTRDLVADANANLRRAFHVLAEQAPDGASRQFGPLTAVAAGVPSPFFNRVFVFADPPARDLSAAVAWLAGRDVPFWVTVTDDTLGAVEAVTDPDLATVAEHPGMVLSDLDEIPLPDSVAEIDPVAGPDDRDAFSSVVTSAFEMAPEVAERVCRLAAAADGVDLLLGRVDGQPAASGLLIRSDDVAGVYWVGVVKAYRRRGIGAAMTRALLRAGRAAGCRLGTLQSSEVGYPLYRALGFETVVTYHHFAPAD